MLTPKPLSDYWIHVYIDLIGCSPEHAWLFKRLLRLHSPVIERDLYYDPNEFSPFIKEASRIYSELRPSIIYTLGE